MASKLYMIPASPPVRTVLLVAKALNVDLEHIPIDLMKRENLSAKFLKINPCHTIPVLEETNGNIIVDSHAISMYLVDKYKPNDPLYPQDLFQRAVINGKLFFEAETLFTHIREIIFPIFLEDAKSVPSERIDAVLKSYDLFETLLEGNDWIAGEDTTIADLSCITSTTTLNFIVPIGSRRYPNISRWLERAQQLPYYKAHQYGLELFGKIYKRKMSSS